MAGRLSDGLYGLDGQSEWLAAEDQKSPLDWSRSTRDTSAALISGGKLQTQTDLSGCFVPTLFLTGSAFPRVLF